MCIFSIGCFKVENLNRGTAVSLCIKLVPSRFLLSRECESFLAPETLPNMSASTCFLPFKSFLVFNLTSPLVLFDPFNFLQFWRLCPRILQLTQKGGCFSYWISMDRAYPSVSTTTDSNNCSDRSTSTSTLAKTPNLLLRVASSIARGVPKPEAISKRVVFLQYSWVICISLTQIWAWVCTWAWGLKPLDQQEKRRIPGFRLTTPKAQVLCISSKELKWNSKKPFPRGVMFQLRKEGHNIESFCCKAKVVKGLSPLCRITLPWRLN